MEEKSFVEGMKKEGTNLFDDTNQDANKENETLSAPSAEKKQEEKSPSPQGETNIEDEKEIPFHKHPRWKQMREELNELREFKEQVVPLLNNSQQKPSEEDTSIPGWFTDAFGNNQDLWKKFSQFRQQDREGIKQEVLTELSQHATQEAEESKHWSQWVEDSLDELKADGKEFDRNKLLKVALDYLPTDEEGNIDFGKAFQIYQILEQQEGKSPSTTAKKKIANMTKGTSKGETPAPDYQTPASMRNRGWTDLIK